MISVDELVARAKRDGASDIHLICGLPPKYRLDGELQDMDPTPLTEEDCEAVARFLARDAYREMEEIGELDLAGTWGG
ncbi:MAG: type IV pili twitching motility protein PilT, partial [Oscillospiraceae bacterium]|nr:type IV pili twitching motility protein PilT [Oscillospiraceae bacterium]